MPEELFEPVEVHGLRLKNRIFHAPTTMNMSDPHGYVTPQVTGVYEALAAGGASLIMVGATCVRHDGLINERMLGIYDDTYVIGLRDLVEVIHMNNAVAGIQLFYGGLIPGLGATVPLEPGKGWIPGTVSWGSSKNAIIGNPEPQVLSTTDYEEIVDAFAQGARRAKEAGFDCVGLHFCHGSLPMTTLSLLSNVGRTDKYADRFLFAEEIIKGIQALCSKDYPIVPRICCDENLEGGYDIDYFVEHYAPRLQALGIAILDCTFGSMLRNAKSRNPGISSNEFIGGAFYTPSVVNFDNIKRTKELFAKNGITIPVVGSCKVATPQDIRKMHYEAGADFVAMCRALLADPDLPRKMEEGREKEIRTCTWTGASLLHGNIFGKGYAGSPENAQFGKEWTIKLTPPPRRQKKVVIVGGGCAGMEAARVATERGHHVVLFEKDKQLGGIMRWAGNYQNLPQMAQIGRIVDYLAYQMEILKVACRLGTEASIDRILSEEPDAVIIASGSQQPIPYVPGLAEARESGRIFTIDEVMTGQAGVGDTVVIWGAGFGLELGLDMARAGRKVCLIEEGPRLNPQPYLWSRMQHLGPWLAQSGTQVLTSATVQRVTPSGVAVLAGGEEQEVPCDTLVICTGRSPANSLVGQLKGKVREVYDAGDCRAPRAFGNAIHEANYIAMKL